jgi:hypothetical protein
MISRVPEIAVQWWVLAGAKRSVKEKKGGWLKASAQEKTPSDVEASRKRIATAVED